MLALGKLKPVFFGGASSLKDLKENGLGGALDFRSPFLGSSVFPNMKLKGNLLANQGKEGR